MNANPLKKKTSPDIYLPGNLRVSRPKVIIHGLLTDREKKETILPPVFGKERQN